jgi:hypothetical protein
MFAALSQAVAVQALCRQSNQAEGEALAVILRGNSVAYTVLRILWAMAQKSEIEADSASLPGQSPCLFHFAPQKEIFPRRSSHHCKQQSFA